VAVAEIIGSAIGAMILIIVAYLLVGNVLTTAEVVSSAQRELTLQGEMRLHTDLTITNINVTGTVINMTVSNTGNEIISDFPHTNVFLYSDGSPGYRVFIYNETEPATPNPGSWTKSILNDFVHPGELDPGETMFVNAYTDSTPLRFNVVICTNNGVYASTVVY